MKRSALVLVPVFGLVAGVTLLGLPENRQDVIENPPASSSKVIWSSPPTPVASKVPEPAERLLGDFSSLFKAGEKDDRVHNIELGAQKLNDSVFKPGEVWSFNDTVGPRTKETGFKDAPTIIMGEVFQDVGGGMCQVSSTVFAAAILTGFEVVRRYPHSRPSSYMPRGLDATVNYPEQCWKDKQDPNICFDLKLTNPYSFPITIRTHTEDWQPDDNNLPKDMRPEGPQKLLRVELWGIGSVAKVDTRWQLHSTPDYQRRWRRGWKPGEWKKKKQVGKPGAEGVLIVDAVWPDGHKTQSLIFSRYKPVDEIWWVGRDWAGENPWE